MPSTHNFSSLAVGILAGVATACLSASAMSGSVVSMLLFMLTPLPVISSGLGWGIGSSVVAALVACALTGIVNSGLSALILALTTCLPAILAAYLAGLARPADEIGGQSDKLVWYALADIVFKVAIALSAGIIISGILIGYNQQFGVELAAEMRAALTAADPQITPNPQLESMITAFAIRLLPVLQPAVSLIVLAANFYLALALVRASGRIQRPKDDWPRAMRLPSSALVLIALALGLSFLGGGIGDIGKVFAGTLGAGFLMSGLAMLHLRSRGQPWRGPMLWLTYLSMSLFAFLAFVFIIAGMFGTARPVQLSDVTGNPKS